ncbi:MAG: hypothetical protein N4J56_004266 [Chroococcidiopsis sp. SAG 2025]|uniref:hypothetical protein n=1 Tax=Chroococcidiopsis sp. SAG 2025 TaxID=171389 RepID=UPI0029372516|nr:hypothetical protein [Chroococcidiopsis sp. SAG 2025]MDV2994612.1 hypothetical protein [Chroococcidiopsis sp. SAG 2025]
MNAEFAQWTVNFIPAEWTQVRNQWEYSHATRFVLQLLGLSALLISVLSETSAKRSPNRTTPKMANLTSC